MVASTSYSSLNYKAEASNTVLNNGAFSYDLHDTCIFFYSLQLYE